METLVQVTDLTRRFGRHAALADVALTLERGEVLGLLGPNGAGKTTCLRILSGNLAPSAGRVLIAGIDLARDPVAAKARLGYLPERPPLHAELRVDEYLTFAARLRRVPPDRLRSALLRVKERCGLEDVGRAPIARLSKGYRQRLGIAQAIIHDPELVILDEPTEGLDPVQIAEVRRLVHTLAESSGVIFSSHILPEVQAVCDRVSILHRGRLVYSHRLRSEGEPRTWRLRLAREVNPTDLTALAPVASADYVQDDRYRVDLAPGHGAPDLARALVHAGMALTELTPERTDLERVFFNLIGAEVAA